jgi:hypothetical protein
MKANMDPNAKRLREMKFLILTWIKDELIIQVQDKERKAKDRQKTQSLPLGGLRSSDDIKQ